MKRIKYELWEIQGLLYILVGLQLQGILKTLVLGYGIFCIISFFIASFIYEVKNQKGKEK